MSIYSIVTTHFASFNTQISSVLGTPYLEFLNITTAEIENVTCISECKYYILSVCLFLPLSLGNSEAAEEYKQPVIVACFGSCASGPFYIEHYTPGYLYWPRIKYRSCDGLICKNPAKKRCTPTQSRQRCQAFCVYKCDMDECTFSGIQFVTYTEHLHCQCECGVAGDCLQGYIWNPQQCKCIKSKRCHPEYYFEPNVSKCLPLLPI